MKACDWISKRVTGITGVCPETTDGITKGFPGGVPPRATVCDRVRPGQIVHVGGGVVSYQAEHK